MPETKVCQCEPHVAKKMRPDQIVLVNLCGRGDKDMLHVAKARGVTIDTDVKLTKEEGYAAMDGAKRPREE